MSSNAVSDNRLNLDRDLPVTGEDVDAQRRLSADVASWFTQDWRKLEALVPADALDRRPVASDTWVPFSLE